MHDGVVFVVEIDGIWTVSRDADVLGSYLSQIEAIDAARLVAAGMTDCRILVQPKSYPTTPEWTFEDPHDEWDARHPTADRIRAPANL